MAITMDDQMTINELSFNPYTTIPRRREAYGVPDGIEILNTSFATSQLRG